MTSRESFSSALFNRYIVLAVFILLGSISLAQSTFEVAKNNPILKAAKSLRNSKPDSSLFLIREVLKDAETTNDTLLLFCAYVELGSYAFTLSDLKLGVKALKKENEIAFTLKGNADVQARNNYDLAYHYSMLEDYGRAYEYLKKAETYYKLKNPDYLREFFSLTQGLLFDMKLYDVAEMNLERCFAWAQENADTAFLMSIYGDYGYLYFFLEDYENELKWYEEYTAMALKSGRVKNYCLAVIGQADAHMNLGNFQEGKKLCYQALDTLARYPAYSRYSIDSKIVLVEIYLKENKLDSCIKLFTEIDELLRQYSTPAILLYYSKVQVKVYKKLGDFDEALRFQEFITDKETRQDSALRAKNYTVFLANKELDNQNVTIGGFLVKNKSQVVEIAAIKNTSFAVLALIIAGGMLFYFFWLQYKESKGRSKRLKAEVDQQTVKLREENAERSLLLNEVHSRVKTNLKLAANFLKLQKKYGGEKDLETIIDETLNRLGCLSAIHEKLYRAKKLSDISTKEYLDEIARYVGQNHPNSNSKISLHLNIRENQKQLSLNELIPCGLIVNELISNSYMHAFSKRESGNIWINFSNINGEAHLEISDDGEGFLVPFEVESVSSLGLTVVSYLLKDLDAKLEHQVNESGSSLSIKFLSE